MINNKPTIEMTPWWYGFTGSVNKLTSTSYEVKGNWEIKDNKLIITELPVGEATSTYKEFLEKLLSGLPAKPSTKSSSKDKKQKTNPLLNYIDNNTDTKVYFELIFEDGYLNSNIDIEKNYKLTKKVSLGNMHLFDPYGKIKKYNSTDEILQDYYKIRIKLYDDRKLYQLKILEYQLAIISYKVKFILLVVNNELIINNKKKSAIEFELESHKFPRMSKSINDTHVSFDYLLSMPIYNLTQEKIEELQNQEHDKQTEYDKINSLTPEIMWINELNILKEKYLKWLESKESAEDSVQTKQKPIKKKK
jgi:DNA topoisomerase-2